MALSANMIKGSIPHYEELPLVYGQQGFDIAMDIHRSILLGTAHITAKIDGAPAIFCGTDPRDGRFFVAKKSVLNKTPIVYKEEADIVGLSDKLARVMMMGLRYFPRPQHMIQGDLLFADPEDHFTLEGSIGVQPNIIFYKMDKRTYKIGVAWHTRYKPELPGICGFKPIANDLPYIPSTDDMYSHSCAVAPQHLDLEAIDDIHNDMMKHLSLTNQYHHIASKDPKELYEVKKILTKYILNRADGIKEVEKFGCSLLYVSCLLLADYTETLISSINRSANNFIRFTDGTLKRVGHEGFVVTGEMGIPCKFVNRSEFSTYNKSDDVIRGWS